MCAEAVRLAAYTGLRFGELRDLRWRDIDRAGRNLHVRRNTSTSAPKSVKS
jgi:integrase